MIANCFGLPGLHEGPIRVTQDADGTRLEITEALLVAADADRLCAHGCPGRMESKQPVTVEVQDVPLGLAHRRIRLDYLLLELVSSSSAGSITGSVMAIERQDESGDDQYLLRVVTKTRDGRYILKANNPDYADLEANEQMRTFARLRGVIPPLDLAIGRAFMREEIPALFGEAFNPGNWNVGHVTLRDKMAHVLLITLNKQGKSEDHRYLDHWIDDTTFHWQTQNATTPESSRGREIINHEKLGISLHLFVRDAKLEGGKAAPFTYEGPVRYQSHTGSAPMSVVLKLT